MVVREARDEGFKVKVKSNLISCVMGRHGGVLGRKVSYTDEGLVGRSRGKAGTFPDLHSSLLYPSTCTPHLRVFTLPRCFPHCCDQMPDKKQFKGGRVCLGFQFKKRHTPPMWGRHGGRSEVAGDIASVVRRQRAAGSEARVNLKPHPCELLPPPVNRTS